jgi:anti-sigma28 factor (negative regulator of flagellin synthesis)
MNMKVTDSNPLAVPSVRPGTPTVRPAQTQTPGKTSESSEVSIGAAAQSVFASRTERVAELRQAVESGSYKPNSQFTSEKLVSGALSRPE